MKKYKVRVEGITPYMQHRMDDQKLEEWEKSHARVVTHAAVSQPDAIRAEFHCHRNSANNKCYIPSEQLRQSFIAAGTLVKSKVGAQTKSMKSIVAGQWMLDEEEIYVPDYDQIDKRSGINRNNKARVMVIRPKWGNWTAEFTLTIDNNTTTDEMVTQIINFAGSNVGIGSYRPTNNGRFGRYKLGSLTLIS
jgi:hypothetical protein